MLLVGICLIGMPAHAAVNFYRTDNGQLVVEATDCRSAQRLMSLVGLPDDPPGDEDDDKPSVNDDDKPGVNDDDKPGVNDDDNPEGDDTNSDQGGDGVDPNTIKGSQQLLQALFGKDDESGYTREKHENLKDVDFDGSTDFEDVQEAFLTFVRDVNWKTGLKLTYRDMSFFRRLRMACSGVNSLTKPLRVNLEAHIGSVDDVVENLSDELVQNLENAARKHSFDKMTKLTLAGLAIAIEVKKPFLLLLLDEDTFNKLVEVNPDILTLYKNMYNFFKTRAILMPGEEYDANTPDLIRVSKYGQGNAFSTWSIMAEFAQNSLEDDRAGTLNANDEKHVRIYLLEKKMSSVQWNVRVEKRAAELAVKDPQNAALMEEVENGPARERSLDYEAQKYWESLTPDQQKHLVRKWHTPKKKKASKTK